MVNGVKYLSSRHGELFPITKDAGTFRIVVFGGSSTENKSAFLEAKTHYPLELQSMLRREYDTDKIDVINVGNSAYATSHSLILLALDVVSWAPDLVILSHNINDLLVAYWPGFQFDYSNKYGTEFYLPDIRKRISIPNVLFQHSQLYWFAKQRVNPMMVDNSLQRLSYGEKPNDNVAQVFRRNLLSFVAIAAENGVRVLLGTQPLQPSEEFFDRHMAFKTYNNIAVYPLHDEFVAHHGAYNEIIKGVARETGVLFAENDAELGGDKRYFIDFVHYTPEGVRRLAESYAAVIISSGMISD